MTVTHEPMARAYLGLAQGVPLVVFQLFGGVLADRTNRLWLLIVTQCLTPAVLAAAFLLAVLGWVRVGHLLVLAALSNIFRAFDEPARLALIPQLIDRARLSNAIALGSIPWQTGRMIGPSVAGILIAAFGGAVGFGLAAGASLVALGLYSRLQVHGTTPTSDGRPVVRQFADGLRFVAGNSVFACLIGLALFNSLFGLSYVTLLPIYADWYFGTGSTGYGLLNAAHGVGALGGTLTVATLATRIPSPGTALLVGATCMGLLMAFSQSPVMGVAMPLLALVGFSNLLPDPGDHVHPAARARPAPRPRAQPLLALLEPPAPRRPPQRRPRRGPRCPLRHPLRRHHGRDQRPPPPDLRSPPLAPLSSQRESRDPGPS